MKYNENLFNISSSYYFKIDADGVDSIDEQTLSLQREILEILIKKIRTFWGDKSQNQNGVLKAKFWSKDDDGYSQIRKLIELGKFDSFASQYCLYLSGIEAGDDKPYYEIVWDYRTYFEALSMHEIDRGIEANVDKSYDRSKIASAIETFKGLSLKHQLAVMEVFTAKVNEEKEAEQKELIEQECINKGHDYGEWKKINYSTVKRNPYLNSRDYIVPKGMEWIKENHTKWERTCSRCGLVETVEQEPQELIDARREKNKQARIRRLEKELKRLKDEDKK